jgi:AraC-like DNA-binding protein
MVTMMHLTKLASAQMILWNILESYNEDPAAVFKRVGLDIEKMRIPGARYNKEKIAKLWEETGRLIEDPCFGLAAATHWHPSYLGTLGYAMLASSSLRITLERLVRFFEIITSVNAGELIEDETNKTLTFNFIYKDNPLPVYREDAALALILSILRGNFQQTFTPVSVSFKHSNKRCLKQYSDFFRSTIYFGAPTSSLTLSLEVADQNLPSGNKELATLNDQIMCQYLADLDNANLSKKVQTIIIEHLPSGNITIENIAKQLAVSSRSLQRRLLEDGETFTSLLDKTRQDIARQYVTDKQYELTEVAFLLGFSELSTFSRSFKRWTGQSPDQYRKVPFFIN